MQGGHNLYSGMLPCFFQGFLRSLVERASRSEQMRARVSRGSSTSSMKPRAAAGNGLANCSVYSISRCAV